MIAQMQGTLRSLQTGTPEGPEEGVTLQLRVQGKVVDANTAAKDADCEMTLHLKKLVAQHLKWGQTLYVTVSTEPPKDQ